MYEMNLPTVEFATKPNKSSVIIYPYTVSTGKKPTINISETEINKEIKSVLSKTAGDVFTSFIGNKLMVFVCLNEKMKNIESVLVKATKLVPAGTKEIAIDLRGLDDKYSINSTLLVSKLILAFKNPWTTAKKEKINPAPEITIVSNSSYTDASRTDGFALGTVQAWIQKMVAMPSNMLTPSIFAEEVKAFLELYSIENLVTFNAYDTAWVLEKKMGSFYSVAKGSVEPLKFLELKYSGNQNPPYVFVGKGVTFDTGGISLKPSKGMGGMKGDMAGAATACATVFYAALTRMDINVVALAPCCENMPSGNAIKPGDVVFASNGKSIEIVNTDAEGRLILADALVYAQEFKGACTIDIATLTGACITALGYEYTGLFSDDEDLINDLTSAGKLMKDNVWHMPMDSEYHKVMLKSAVADMSNSSEGAQGAGATNGAIFLKEFAPESGWAHLDIAGVSEVRGSASPTGRPMAMLARFMSNRVFNNK